MGGIVVCIGQSQSGPLVLSYLEGKIPVKAVIREAKESKSLFIKRRIKRLGIWKVLGQLVFMAVIPRLLSRRSRARIDRLLIKHKLHTNLDQISFNLIDVDSINSDEAHEVLKKNTPDLILEIGTRIINKKTLKVIDSRWINIHAGITPLFRGVHGGYWARVIGEKMGTTIHFIDEGIDTGSVIFQKEIDYRNDDNFFTYPYIQMIGILTDLEKVLKGLIQGEALSMKPIYQESRLWTHPTFFQYIYYKFARRIG